MLAATAQDISFALDPCLLFEQCVGGQPDPWQEKFLLSEASKRLLLCARQSGKSTVVAVEAIRVAMFKPGALVLILSPSQRQSSELRQTISAALGRLAEAVEVEAGESQTKITLANGSRILALPGLNDATIRGFASVDLLILDEAARIPDDVFRAALPMMLNNPQARIVLLSTPYGGRGFFWEQYTEAADQWEVTKVTVYDNPRATEDFIKSMRELLGEYAFQQEMMCEALNGDVALFTTRMIQQMDDPKIEVIAL